MKLGLQEHSNHTVGAVSEDDIVIDSNGVAFYGQITGLVADKVGYPMREIPTNAWDAARGDFDVHLPTSESPIFRVRDRGQGMTPDQMNKVFKRMYVSTKREDTDVVGGWGIGRFSPLAYLINEEGAGSYTVTSWTGGMMRIYTVSVQPGGIPKISEMGTFPSDEPTGMEISFAVRREDIRTFYDRAKKILWSFTPRPNIFPAIDWEDEVILSQGKGWTRYKEYTTPLYGPHVKMGCVTYPISLIQVPNNGFVDGNDNIVFDVPIGSVKITLSREALQYDTRTKAKLRELLQGYEQDFVASVKAEVESAPSLFEAVSIFNKMTDNLGQIRQDRIRNRLRWNRLPLSADLDIPNAKLMKLREGWQDFDKFSEDKGVSTTWPIGAKVVIEHNPMYSAGRFDMAGLKGQHVLWVRCKRFYREQVLTALGNPEVIDLDSFKVPVEKRPKTFRKRRTLQLTSWHHVDREVQSIDLAAGGIYIQASNNTNWRGNRSPGYVLNGRHFNINGLTNIFTKLNELEIISNDTVVVVANANEVMPEGWTSLHDEILEPLQSLVDLSHLDAFSTKSQHHMDHILSTFCRLPEADLMPPDLRQFHRDAAALYELLGQRQENRVGNEKSDMAVALLESMGHAVVKPVFDCPIAAIGVEWNRMQQRFPLLHSVVTRCYHSSGDSVKHDYRFYMELLCREPIYKENSRATPTNAVDADVMMEAA
jgi:hypothetical protein